MAHKSAAAVIEPGVIAAVVFAAAVDSTDDVTFDGKAVGAIAINIGDTISMRSYHTLFTLVQNLFTLYYLLLLCVCVCRFSRLFSIFIVSLTSISH